MRRSLWLIFIIVLLIGGFATWLLTSEAGARWALKRVIQESGQPIEFEQLQGSLLGPLQLQGLSYHTPEWELQIEGASVQWQPSRLWGGTLSLSPLSLEGVTLRQLAKELAKGEPSQPFSGLLLPFRLQLQQATVQRLTIVPLDGAPLLFPKIELAGSWLAGRVTLRQLAVETPWGELAGSGRLATRPAGEVDLQLDWRLDLPQLAAPLEGRSNVGGSLARLTSTHQLNAPARLTAQGELAWLTVDPTWSFSARLDRVNPQTLVAAWPLLTLNGDVTGRGDLQRGSFAGKLQVSQQDMGDWHSEFTGEFAPGRWHLSQFALQQSQGPTRLAGRFTYEPDNAAPLQLDARWEHLAWPLSGESQISSAEGMIQINGAPSGYQTELDGELTLFGLPSSHWQLAGRGDLQGLQSETLNVRWLAGDWQGQGRLDWRETFAWDATLRGEGIDPASAGSPWPGRLSGVLSSRKIQQQETSTIELVLDDVQGQLQGQPVTGRARVNFIDGATVIETLQARVGDARLSGQGKLGEKLALNWQLEIPSLQQLDPQLQGRVQAKGQAGGTRQSPEITVNGEGQALAWQQQRLASLVMQGRLAGPDLQATLALTATDLVTADTTLAKEVRLTAQGALEPTGWRLTLQQGRFTTPGAGVWQQPQAAQLWWGDGIAQLSQFCWQQGVASICGQGQFNRAADSWGELRFDQLDLALWQPWLPWGIELQGRAEGELRATQRAGQLNELELSLGSGGGLVSYPLSEEERHTTVFQQLAGRLNYDQDGPRSQFTLYINPQNQLQGELAMPGWQLDSEMTDQQAVTGQLSLTMTDLGLLPLLVPDIANPQGQVTAQLGLSGTYEWPQWRGGLALRETRFDLPRFGLQLERVGLRGQIGEGNRLSFDGAANSGEGQVRVSGQGEVQGLTQWQLQGQLQGERFEVLRWPEVQLLVSPQLDVAVRPGELRVDGQVTIPKARVEYTSLNLGVTLSPDVVIVDRDLPVAEKQWRVISHILLVIGEDNRITGHGFEGSLSGQVALINEPPAPLGMWGEVNIDKGRYRAYGQDLQVQMGRLMFAGSALDNPGIDLQAVRVKGEVTAGIHATGRLAQPQLTLFSQPPMDQADVLSYIVLGQPLSMSSQQDADALYQAANSIGLAGGEILSKRIGGYFGIEEVAIESGESTEEAQLIVGKQLSSRLYLRYAHGLWNNLNTLLARYQLSRHWSLETQSGVESSADLKYTIER